MISRAAEVLWGEIRAVRPLLLIVQFLVRLLPLMAFARLRTAFYRFAGLKIGPGVLTLGPLELVGEAAEHLTIGARCVLNSPCFFDLNASITLGDDVSIGHHAVFVTASHLIGSPGRRAGLLSNAPIVIQDGAWIGASVTVLPGVTIGKGSIVTAGSLVAADVPPNKMVGGVPARVIKALPER